MFVLPVHRGGYVTAREVNGGSSEGGGEGGRGVGLNAVVVVVVLVLTIHNMIV